MAYIYLLFFPYRPAKKRTKFRWKTTHDVQLLTEVISVEPYRWKHGSRERGDAFRNIAVNLTEIPNSGFPPSLNQRSVRTKFFELVESFKKQETQEARATGIATEFDEKTQLLTDIHSRMVEYENGFLQELKQKKDKVEKEKATAEEMRKKACEKRGETKKRHELEDTPPCRKRKSTEFLEYLKYKQDSNKENTEKQLKIREQEIMLEKQRMDVQQNMQNQMVEQMKMQQESQKAMFNLFETFMNTFKQS